jgi:redox-sensitive bicupin YhaK (pirin superfamily)
VYVYRGSVTLAGDEPRGVARGQIALLGPGGDLVAEAASEAGLLLVAGRPLGEPVARYGPFVMNTEAEIRQAFADYQSGRFQGASE